MAHLSLLVLADATTIVQIVSFENRQGAAEDIDGILTASIQAMLNGLGGLGLRRPHRDIMIGFLGWILVLVVLQQLKVPIWIWIIFVIGTLIALMHMG